MRDGLLSLVHSYSSLENKLDRHEQRERSLGEVIKRGLQTLQKGQKVFEPMRGTFTRLDERMSQIETVLMEKDEKNMEQQDRIGKALDSILKLLGEKGAILPSARQSAENSDEAHTTFVPSDLGKQIEQLAGDVKALRKEMKDLAADREKSLHASSKLLEQTDKLINAKSSTSDDFISRLDEKFAEYYVTTSVPPTQEHNTEWEENVSISLKEIKNDIDALRTGDVLSTLGGNQGLSGLDKNYFVTLHNETLEAIEDMRIEVLTASDKSFTKTATRIKESADNLDSSISEVLKTVAESATTAETLNEGVSTSLNELKNEIKGLNKLETVLLQMGDNILSIKRGMEFNVHAISLEVGDLIKTNSKELNHTINERFDVINETIVSNHNGALTNLTSKIETEISQVWRQIGIMYQEVSSSKDALTKLQELNEAYVNGTFSTMDSMEGKVTRIPLNLYIGMTFLTSQFLF